MALSFKPWKPYQARLTPPLGFYDPVLDANLGSARRGLLDTTQDVETQRGRLTSDYALGQQRINTSAGRSLEDIATQRTQGTEDHDRALADLRLAYERRANQQKQQQNAMGVLHGGAALQAAAKRSANQAHDQAPIDIGFQRLMSGLDIAGRRVTEDQQMDLGSLGLGTERGLQDLTSQLTRAQREGGAYELDTAAAKGAQAVASGWNPYAGRPKNEIGRGSNARRVITRGGYAYTIDPSGRVISKRRVR